MAVFTLLPSAPTASCMNKIPKNLTDIIDIWYALDGLEDKTERSQQQSKKGTRDENSDESRVGNSRGCRMRHEQR